MWAESGSAGKLEEWVKEKLGWTLEIVKRPFEGMRSLWVPPGVESAEIPRGFVVVKRRSRGGTNLRVAGTFTSIEQGR